MQNVIFVKWLKKLYQDAPEIWNIGYQWVNVKLFQELCRHFVCLVFIFHSFGLLSDQERENFNDFNSSHTEHFTIGDASEFLGCLGDESLEDFFELEAVESLNFGKVKIGMENDAIVGGSVFLFGHGIVDDFVDFWGSVENIKEAPDDLLVVGDVGFGLDIGGGFFDDFVDSCREVWEGLG